MEAQSGNAGLGQLLKNKPFFRLFMAETISYFGDAVTWVGLALLAYNLAGIRSAEILAIALTIRVITFVIFAPYAGVLADRLDRKKIMVICHFSRMAIVFCLPFVTAIWQLYMLVLVLNFFNAFFTPAYQASIPMLVREPRLYARAISISAATFQLLEVFGPGIAGGIAAFMGAGEIFFVDAATFLIAGVIIVLLPTSLQVATGNSTQSSEQTWKDIKAGTSALFRDKVLLLALLMQLVASIMGAQILVNTVGFIKGSQHLNDLHYGWIMSSFGIGAAIAAFLTGFIKTQQHRITVVILGALITAMALIPANFMGFYGVLPLWSLSGAGGSLVNIPMQTLIADRIPEEKHGRVYGAHFAWSHLWWAFSYPLAGWFGRNDMVRCFFHSGLFSTFLCLLLLAIFFRKGMAMAATGLSKNT